MSNVPGVVGTGLRYHQAEAQHVDIILRFFYPEVSASCYRSIQAGLLRLAAGLDQA